VADRIVQFFAVGLAAFIACAHAAEAPTAVTAPQSVEDFFRKSQYGGAVLSPSGRYLAVIVPVGGHRGLGIIDLDTRATLQSMTAGDGDIVRIVWQSDERLIALLGDLQEVAGEPPREWGMVAVNRDGSDLRVLARKEITVANRSRTRRSFERPWTVDLQRAIVGTNHVLLTARERDIKSLDLYRYDTLTGEKTLLSFDSPGNVDRWVVDFDGVPRAAVSNDVDHDTSAWFARKSANDAWTKIGEAKLGRLNEIPLQFDADGKILYVTARRDGADRWSIYEYNIETNRWGGAVIRHPERDVERGNAGFFADYQARKLLGLRYANDRPSVEWFDPEWARIQKSVDAALPDTINFIQGREDAKRWVVVAYSDRNPGEAFLLDAKTMRMQKLFSYRPWIDSRSMAPMKWVRYPARDGLQIPALLTVPASANGKPVPLIVDIHGGPHIEATTWGYSAEVQFFASRGYAVLQPQFRGTAGFGWKHLSSGYRKWGDEMQDDLEDGVKWAIAQGIADSSRVCFYGGSYGGYAAIWGAIKNPGLIKCSVAIVAVTSIDYLFDNAQTDLARLADRSTVMDAWIGDPKTERARFKRVSPLDNADKVGVPLLLAYGGSDVRVPIVHGTDFRAALDKYHKEYEWVQYSIEGHGFNRDEDVFDFYRRVERFLAKYLQSEAPVAKPATAGDK
jgi:dipeptidyl aminopeptidase/acylaminoacyl peptidase